MSVNTSARVTRFAQNLVEDLRLNSMQDFSSDDIEFIALHNQISFTEVVDILAPELA